METEFIIELTQIHPKILKEEGIVIRTSICIMVRKTISKKKEELLSKIS